ncbi:hypothetical protein [Vibrio quintilis]|uniref:hypothetical protein n=1 Tax=Vibrio quintilis TaxID=1117707 RepID=UPI000935ADA8|nr:hypothetical protein [Vibrio quintilis]
MYLEKMIRLLVCLLMLAVVIAFFFPKRLYIHYDNPEFPVVVELSNYDQTKNKILLSDGVGMMVIKRPLVETIFSKDQNAMIHWSYASNQAWIGHLDIIGHSGQPYLPDVCRLDIYLDQQAHFIRYETKDFWFLNFCW